MIRTFRFNNGFLLFCFFVLSLPVSLLAQEYGGGLLGYGEKGAEQQRGPLIYIDYNVEGNNFGNQPFGVDPNNYNYSPIGSGLFVFILAGVGYALVKSKRSRSKSFMIITALSLMLGFTQCKKDNVVPETPVLEGEKYTIFLTLGGGSDSKADVYPFDAQDIAPVYYKEGDSIQVVYGGIKVGAIGCYESHIPTDPADYLNDLAKFKGEITIGTITGDPLYFYFIGNQVQTKGTSTFVVDLSDQTTQLPVISYARSNEPFADDRDHYTIYNGYNNIGANWLLNQCALVKFECENFYDISANTYDNNPYAIYKTGKPITIYGMDNHVEIDLTKPGDPDQFAWSQVSDGAMTLYRLPVDRDPDSVARYAIVHHKNYGGVTEGELSVPFNPASDPYGFYGTYKIDHNVQQNDYFAGAKIDLVWHSGAFKVKHVPADSVGTGTGEPGQLHLSETLFGRPTYIVFSRGNLQYNNSYVSEGGRWRFAKHQYDFVGGGLGEFNNTYLGNVVLNENNSASPALSSGSSSGRSDNEQIQNPSTYAGWIDLYGWGTGDNPMKAHQENTYYSSWHEWGNHPIFNDGTSKSSSFWYTLGRDEWQWLLEHRDGATDKVGFATVNGVKGMILLPEIWPGQPSGCPAWEKAGTHLESNSWNNTYSEEQWRNMELQGAVFLPAAGYRGSVFLNTYCYDYDCGTGIPDGADQNWGAYWSSTKATKYTDGSSFYMRFGQGIVDDHVNPGYYMAPDNGNAVRLVHEVGSASKFGCPSAWH